MCPVLRWLGCKTDCWAAALVIAGLLLALGWPVAARAGMLERKTLDGRGQYVYTSGASEADSVVVERVPNGAGTTDDAFAYSDGSAFTPRPSVCVPLPAPNPANTMECPTAGIEELTFPLESRDDAWESRERLGIASPVEGGPGKDSLISRGGRTRWWVGTAMTASRTPRRWPTVTRSTAARATTRWTTAPAATTWTAATGWSGCCSAPRATRSRLTMSVTTAPRGRATTSIPTSPSGLP